MDSTIKNASQILVSLRLLRFDGETRELKIQDFMNKAIPDLWGDQRILFGLSKL